MQKSGRKETEAGISSEAVSLLLQNPVEAVDKSPAESDWLEITVVLFLRILYNDISAIRKVAYD